MFAFVTELRVFVRNYGFDVLIAFGAITSALIVIFGRHVTGAPTTPLWFAAPAVAVVVLPLLARRSYPFLAPASVWLIAAAFSFVDGRLVVFPLSVYVAGMAAAYLLGNLVDGVRACVGLAIVLLAVTVIVVNNPDHAAGDYVLPGLFAVVWLAGFAVRARAARAEAAEQRASWLEQTREQDARQAIADERARIARELHDVVAHSVSVMTVQSSAVRRLLTPDQDKEREALLTVEQTGREALAEMRRLVGVLRRSDQEAPSLAPQPGLSDVDTLVAHAERSGLPVDVRVVGEPVRLPASIDLTAFRLVQEGLTNAIRHASADHAEVRLCYAAGYVEVEVLDDGRGSDGAGVGGGGHGLLGMRERVSIYGGQLDVGPRAEGGFRLHARLPVAG
jgi:signal transduction histidine kinase